MKRVSLDNNSAGSSASNKSQQVQKKPTQKCLAEEDSMSQAHSGSVRDDETQQDGANDNSEQRRERR